MARLAIRDNPLPVFLSPAFSGLVITLSVIAFAVGGPTIGCSVLGLGFAVPAMALAIIASARISSALGWMFGKRVFRCPQCSSHNHPMYRCPNQNCSTLIVDLYPSRRGIFRAACPGCGHSIPTMDRFGRTSIQRVCRTCDADIEDRYVGTTAQFSFAVVGARSGGKSHLMMTAVWYLEEHFGPNNDMQIRFGDPNVERTYRQHVARLKQGIPLQQTVQLPIPRAFPLYLETSDGTECLLYLYDAAGEDFASEDSMSGHPLEKYDAVLFVVDPWAEPSIRQSLERPASSDEVRHANPAPLESTEILGRLLNELDRKLRIRPGGLISIPIAVVVSKADVCGLEESVGLADDEPDRSYSSMLTAAEYAEFDSNRVREFLVREQLGNLVQIVESRFAQVAYFATAALAKSDDPRDLTFHPRRVLNPLIWQLYSSDAIGSLNFMDRIFVNANREVLRACKGIHGPFAQLAVFAWALAFIAFCGVLYVTLPPMLLLLAVAPQIAGLLFLYIYHFYEFVYLRIRE